MRLSTAILLASLLSPATTSGLLADHGMVATEHRLASAAGVEILRSGGNAVDAAVAAALAVCVVNPSSCGIGGGGFMLIFDRRHREMHALDYRETAPGHAHSSMFLRSGRHIPELSLDGGLAVAVPGEVAGLDAALHRFGTLPWRIVSAPAIALARDGFAVEPHLARAIARQADRLRANPALASVFLHPDGSPLAVGERLVQADLAATLERIAAAGPTAFYRGQTARAIARSVATAGGVLDESDLRAYRPRWRRPVRVHFHGLDIFGMPPPSSGGGLFAEVLRILDRDDLAALQLDSATYTHLLAEAMQFGFADRASFYGDPDFRPVPLAQLLSSQKALRRRRAISAATTFSTAFYGAAASQTIDDGTSHLSVVDAQGNAVACTTSINTAFGAAVMAEGTGVLLNNTMDDFAVEPGTPNVYGLVGSAANAIQPGKRPLSSMAPTIALRDGVVRVVVGGSGGPLILSATLQVLLDAVAFSLDSETAVAEPRLHHQWLPKALMLEPSFDVGVRVAMQRLGHHVVELPAIAAVQIVQRRADGRLDGASDPRKGGEASGW
jgi:gamma-glutamyltranspeptidase / glutathione hydrolase